ncbi:hypothetical protein Taro_020664 [Colocasia esculenta]|uniref:Peptidase C19 ubiquitin carboxyl-terminal hydrolase domain-containing protein n=1 Tax=Colocasia esculenta TaxID=4460 RepID=A0A843UWX8_COLES|nr:hypothetical protein [Colocasia esculenta]
MGREGGTSEEGRPEGGLGRRGGLGTVPKVRRQRQGPTAATRALTAVVRPLTVTQGNPIGTPLHGWKPTAGGLPMGIPIGSTHRGWVGPLHSVFRWGFPSEAPPWVVGPTPQWFSDGVALSESPPPNEVFQRQEGIPPRMFKAVIAANHPEFSSMRQQDALEFFLHFLDGVERANAGKPEFDPSRCFKFCIEERLQCPSGKVAYNKRTDYILSLNIPLHEATNRVLNIIQRLYELFINIVFLDPEELEAFRRLTAENSEANQAASNEIVRPRVPLEACLETFSAPEEIHGFYSTALDAKTTAIKQPKARFKNPGIGIGSAGPKPI